MGQVLVGTGHGQLDLVADALLRTLGGAHSRDAEQEVKQQNPKDVWTGLRVHLSGAGTTLSSVTLVFGHPVYVVESAPSS